MSTLKEIDEVAKILHEEYVSNKSFSIVDRLSRVTHKETAVQVLYDALRGISDEKRRQVFRNFIDTISVQLEKGDFYYVKLLALKALGR
jgi:hypothetical protein